MVERGREPDLLHEQRDADDEQQRGRREHLAQAGRRDVAQDRRQQKPAASDDGRDRRQHEQRLFPAGQPVQRTLVAAGLRTRDREQRQHREDRDDGDILEEQHRERRLATGGLEQALFAQRLERDRRRRHCKNQPDRERGHPREAERQARPAGHDGRAGDLQSAHAEDRSAHAPEQRRLQLEPDEEEHHDDAELCEVHHVPAVIADQLQRVRSDRYAGEQIAQHRAEPEPLRQRDRQHRRQQINERLRKWAVHVWLANMRARAWDGKRDAPVLRRFGRLGRIAVLRRSRPRRRHLQAKVSA